MKVSQKLFCLMISMYQLTIVIYCIVFVLIPQKIEQQLQISHNFYKKLNIDWYQDPFENIQATNESDCKRLGDKYESLTYFYIDIKMNKQQSKFWRFEKENKNYDIVQLCGLRNRNQKYIYQGLSLSQCELTSCSKMDQFCIDRNLNQSCPVTEIEGKKNDNNDLAIIDLLISQKQPCELDCQLNDFFQLEDQMKLSDYLSINKIENNAINEGNIGLYIKRYVPWYYDCRGIKFRDFMNVIIQIDYLIAHQSVQVSTTYIYIVIEVLLLIIFFVTGQQSLKYKDSQGFLVVSILQPIVKIMFILVSVGLQCNSLQISHKQIALIDLIQPCTNSSTNHQIIKYSNFKDANKNIIILIILTCIFIIPEFGLLIYFKSTNKSKKKKKRSEQNYSLQTGQCHDFNLFPITNLNRQQTLYLEKQKTITIDDEIINPKMSPVGEAYVNSKK